MTNSADCLLVIQADGIATYLNDQAPTLLGNAESEHPPAWDCFWPGPRSRKAASEALDTALCGRVARFEGRTEFVAGESRWWSVVLCPVRDAAGQVDSVFAALRDVTNMKEVEAESRRRATFAQQLMGIVSHDLRNPIGAILLSASHLKRRSDLDAKVKRSLERMIWSAERANRLIYDLLDFTQAQLKGGLRIRRQRVDVHEIVQRVVEESRAAHPTRTIELTTRGLPTTDIDPDRVSQLITNLVANALQYSPDGSVVKVDVTSSQSEVCILVHNAGPAIEPALLERLFAPMQRGAGRSQARSIGLGLYIVKLVAQAHGGEAAVRSGATGTEFIITLPTPQAKPGTAQHVM